MFRTWPPLMICVPKFNHKIGNATHPGNSGDLCFTKSHKWNKQQWSKWTTRLYSSKGAPIQGRWSKNLTTTEILKILNVAWRWSVCSLLFSCNYSIVCGIKLIFIHMQREFQSLSLEKVRVRNDLVLKQNILSFMKARIKWIAVLQVELWDSEIDYH